MILLTVLMILLGSFYKLEEAIPTSLSRLSRPTIILDAGHGGEDGGAVGVMGLLKRISTSPLAPESPGSVGDERLHGGNDPGQ